MKNVRMNNLYFRFILFDLVRLEIGYSLPICNGLPQNLAPRPTVS